MTSMGRRRRRSSRSPRSMPCTNACYRKRSCSTAFPRRERLKISARASNSRRRGGCSRAPQQTLGRAVAGAARASLRPSVECATTQADVCAPRAGLSPPPSICRARCAAAGVTCCARRAKVVGARPSRRQLPATTMPRLTRAMPPPWRQLPRTLTSRWRHCAPRIWLPFQTRRRSTTSAPTSVPVSWPLATTARSRASHLRLLRGIHRRTRIH
mmetsp:Transcript_887/g.3471  ORF Transcript_887/g.3471 Transcript_887/m.3471 type:complete len:213 (+) Transcript_887:1013-1651(+)